MKRRFWLAFLLSYILPCLAVSELSELEKHCSLASTSWLQAQMDVNQASLALAHQDIDDSCLHSMLRYMAAIGFQPTSMDLSNNQITHVDANDLVEYVPQLKALDLSYNEMIWDENASTQSQHPALRHLRSDGQLFTGGGALAWGKWLAHFRQLATVTCHYCHIDNTVLDVFISWYTGSSLHMTELDLAFNDINNRGVKRLLSSQLWLHLSRLNLAYNAVGDVALNDFVQWFEANPSVEKEVALHGNYFSQQGHATILQWPQLGFSIGQ